MSMIFLIDGLIGASFFHRDLDWRHWVNGLAMVRVSMENGHVIAKS